jgi:hypothetical protein
MKNGPVHLFLGVMIFLALVMLAAGTVLADSTSTVIQAGDYWQKDLSQDIPEDDDKITLDLSVSENTKVDVYIISTRTGASGEKSQYEKYKDGESFNAGFQRENVNLLSDEDWDLPHHDYMLVVDNQDNGHSNDANSGEDVTVYISYDTSKDLDFWMIALGCGLCCLLPVGLIVAYLIYNNRSAEGYRPPHGQRTPWRRGGQGPYTPPPSQSPPPRPKEQQTTNAPNYKVGDYWAGTATNQPMPPPFSRQEQTPPPLKRQGNMPPPLPGAQPSREPPQARPTGYTPSNSPRSTPPPSQSWPAPSRPPESSKPPSWNSSTPPPIPDLRGHNDRYVIIQNIGEYVAGGKVDIQDSVVQRSNLGRSDDPQVESFDPLKKQDSLHFYESILRQAWEDGNISESEFRMLKSMRGSERISFQEHKEIEQKIVDEKGVTPMRCPQCGNIGEFKIDTRTYYCPRCKQDI